MRTSLLIVIVLILIVIIVGPICYRRYCYARQHRQITAKLGRDMTRPAELIAGPPTLSIRRGDTMPQSNAWLHDNAANNKHAHTIDGRLHPAEFAAGWQSHIAAPSFTYWSGGDYNNNLDEIEHSAELCPNPHICDLCPRYGNPITRTDGFIGDIIGATIGAASSKSANFIDKIRAKLSFGGAATSNTVATETMTAPTSLLRWRPGDPDISVIVDEVEPTATAIYGWWGGRESQDTFNTGMTEPDENVADAAALDQAKAGLLPEGYRAGPGVGVARSRSFAESAGGTASRDIIDATNSRIRSAPTSNRRRGKIAQTIG